MSILKAKPRSNIDLIAKLDQYASQLLDENYVDEKNDDVEEETNYDITRKINKIGVSLRQKKKIKKQRKITLNYSEKDEEPKKMKKTVKESMWDELRLDLVKNYLAVVEETVEKPPDPKIVVFYDPSKKKPKHIWLAEKQLKEQKNTEEIPVENEEDGPEFDMKKSRHEVLKFGISGFEKKSKEEANIALAVRLGAKPPKRGYTNYRELMENKKKLKVEAAREELTNRRTHMAKAKKSRDRNKVAGFDAQIGKFKDGVQVLKTRDIKKVTAKKHRQSFNLKILK